MGKKVYLIYGSTGWLGGICKQLLEEGGLWEKGREGDGKEVHVSRTRLEDRKGLEEDFEKYKPTHVICSAGVTGRPNVDWCETHREETIRTNVLGTLNLADLTCSRNIHCTLFATGCIFEYDATHTIGGKGFTEDDEPNFAGSFYSKTKGYMDQMLKEYPNMLILRVRMPISNDLNPRSFVTKIVSYNKVVDIPNSMTVLPELLPLSLAMAAAGLTGTYNFCNPGAISHNQVLSAYKKHVDPDFTWENFPVEEQAKIISAGRSNNELDCTKLEKAAKDLNMPLHDIHTAVDGAMKAAREAMDKAGTWPDALPKKLGPGNKPQ
eukprot:CAMPEP_0206239148 /NCGR_PEP_ID=MMETSP0047_2-20121206/15220_1 /ASSEMBLY_ACC=CAM_ASM_000192 /TAXON_ID=195065 /ORGANISM="Chroomonas mesostigmatica_cf, Strain CCMP1168" /LENGTH=321 /DNA_ID=CAMNT_0053663783 /DNA_START=33 /DNA_END=998 /DNA_ORIENTATION=+